MVRIQRLTGVRPGEACSLNWTEIDRSEAVWVYHPMAHKNAHRGMARSILIGPKGQSILMRYLSRPGHLPLSSPGDSEAERRVEARRNRKSKTTPSPRAKQQATALHPKRVWREGYTTRSYGLSVRRAVKIAFRPMDMADEEFENWRCPQHRHPNQLRHARATEIRSGFGLDAAGAVLGHSRIETMQAYAERNAELAARVALATG